MLLGFYQRFVPKIENGIKIHTMRDERKNEPKIGETLHMYTGGYNASRRLVCNTHKLVTTQTAEMNIWVQERALIIIIGGRKLSQSEGEEFVINDGFESVTEFIDFWIAKLPKKDQKNPYTIIEWKGKVHHWTNLVY